MITASSASQSTMSDTKGSTTSSFAPMSAGMNLAKSVGYSGISRPSLQDVVAVVETHTQDLLGPWDHRREVEAIDRSARATRPLGTLAPIFGAQQLADITHTDVDGCVPVHPHGARAVTVSNRRKLHAASMSLQGDDKQT